MLYCELTFCSCSLGCYQTHKPTHPPTADVPQVMNALPPKPSINEPPEAQIEQDNNVKPASNGTSSSTIETSPEFQRLLVLFPQLRDLLRQVYSATLEPTPEELEARANNNGRSSRGGRGGRGHGRVRHYNSSRPWTREQGLKNALHVMRKIRSKDGRNSDALRAFSELVVKLRSNKLSQAQGQVG